MTRRAVVGVLIVTFFTATALAERIISKASLAKAARPADGGVAGFDCAPACDTCEYGTANENNCDEAREGDGICDCGCQFDDLTDCGCSECDTCAFGSVEENNCSPSWEEDHFCDCGCQFDDVCDCTCPPDYDYCWIDSTCDPVYQYDGDCDCGCGFSDYGCDGCGADCDYCWIGTSTENNCPGSYQCDLDCDCGCQFNQPDYACLGTPTGACCYDDGSCDVTFEACCTGSYQGDGISCDIAACAQPTGACCLFPITDKCQELTQAQCTGNYRGDGTTCDSGTCVGACCSPGGCSVTFADSASCDPANFLGLGTTCDSDPCTPPVTGACCGDNFCVDDTTLPNCALDFFPGQTCAQTCVGACCGIDAGSPACDVRLESECLALTRSYRGDGSTCETITCPEFGACCIVDRCILWDETSCGIGGGIYRGDDSDCDPNICAGACCESGSCAMSVASDCDGPVYYGDGSTCDASTCDAPPVTGACCLSVFGAATAGGSTECVEQPKLHCTANGGAYQGDGTSCDDAGVCNGACCVFVPVFPAPVLFCEENVSDLECFSIPLPTEFHPGMSCVEAGCAEPTGACCVSGKGPRLCLDGEFEGTPVNATTCRANFGGIYLGDGTRCGDADNETCPTGACCVDGDVCLDSFQDLEPSAPPFGVTEQLCSSLIGGTFQGPGTICEANTCGASRLSVSKKGSLLIFPKIELKWDSAGVLKQDTFLTLVNDSSSDVKVKWYFVNGDEPLDALVGPGAERAHRGWNWVDCTNNLTGHQSNYLSMASGFGPDGTCSPFTITDTGMPPGRPDPNASEGHRYLRGFAIAFAIDENGEEICWNHLTGGAQLVAYNIPAAWEYSAYAFQALHCDTGGTLDFPPGKLKLDGVEFDNGYNQLVLDYFAVGSTAMTNGTRTVQADAELTLLPLDIDLRQDNDGPTTTKAEFEVYNQNEEGRSGMTRCITCWDSALMSNYALTNHFTYDSLQTDIAKTRINGVASPVCDDECEWRWMCDPSMIAGLTGGGCGWVWFCEVRSQGSSLVGVVERILGFSGAITGTGLAGTTLVGQGTEEGKIRFDIPEGPEHSVRDFAASGMDVSIESQNKKATTVRPIRDR